MNPAKGQTVSLYLRYGFQIEGMVKEWDENQIILTSGAHHFIIYNPREDLIMAKIMGKSRLSGIVQPVSGAQSQPAPMSISLAEQMRHTNAPKPIENTIEGIGSKSRTSDSEGLDNLLANHYAPKTDELALEIDEVIASPSGNSLRIKKLGQLRTMLASAEKEVIAAKLTSHNIAPKAQTAYVEPISLFKRTR